jgi:hypothetical protein
VAADPNLRRGWPDLGLSLRVLWDKGWLWFTAVATACALLYQVFLPPALETAVFVRSFARKVSSWTLVPMPTRVLRGLRECATSCSPPLARVRETLTITILRIGRMLVWPLPGL